MAQPQQQHYQSPFGDTTLTKVFVGGIAWETPTDIMRTYFEQFGEILEAVIINDKNTGKSKGYGFVTFRDPESAERACADPNPVIGGRRANCNVASLGRPRPSPTKVRNLAGNLYQGGAQVASSPLHRPLQPPPPPSVPLSRVVYPPYGYTAYPPDYAHHHQAMYSPNGQQTQYYNSNQLYGYSFYYGPRGATFSMPQQRLQGPSYLYYPAQAEASSSSYVRPRRLIPFPPSPGAAAAATETSTETEAGPGPGPATSTS